MREIFENFGYHRKYQDFFVIDPDRINIASSQDKDLGNRNLITDQAPKFLTRAFSGETVIVPPHHSDFLNETKLVLYIVAPITDENNQVLAVLALETNLDFLNEITIVGRFDKTGETYAFDFDGCMLGESRLILQVLLRLMSLYPEKKSRENI